MAILKKYIKTIHDIHTYNPDATYDPRVQGNHSGYNSQCQAFFVNWSGISLRPRVFCRTTTTTAGFTEPYDINSINFWNTCNPCAVLVSPKHAIICQHYRGTHPREEEYYTFMGVSGIFHTRKVIKATFNVGNDHTLLEFETEFPNDVKYYDLIADIKYIAPNHAVWIHDSNGKAYKVNFVKAQLDSTGKSVSFSHTPCLDGINDGISTNGWPCIFVGDSGSPSFVVDQYDRTILVGLMNGGMQINDTELNNINTIINVAGYSVKHVKLTAKIQDLNQDGKVDAEDMAILMTNWNQTKELIADLNNDGKVDAQDLSLLLANWGQYQIPSTAQIPVISPPDTSTPRR